MKTSRPKKIPDTGELRTKRFELRLSEAERSAFLELEKSLGISRADIVRIRVLREGKKMLVNTTQIMKQLDNIGTELGRSGNNINQLSRHANSLQQQGLLRAGLLNELSPLLSEYTRMQRSLERSLRQLIRLIRGQT